MGRTRENLSGDVFGRLVAVYPAPNITKGKKQETAWLCQCECGNVAIYRSRLLKSGEATSCGCAKRLDCETCHGTKYHSSRGNPKCPEYLAAERERKRVSA